MASLNLLSVTAGVFQEEAIFYFMIE